MKNSFSAIVGITLGAVGIALGLSMSSAVSAGPMTFGLVGSVYAAVAAAVFAGAKRKQADSVKR